MNFKLGYRKPLQPCLSGKQFFEGQLCSLKKEDSKFVDCGVKNLYEI